MSKNRPDADRRKHKRFRLQNGIFVESTANSPNLGQIIDISLGGLSFCWMCGIEKPFKTFEFDILLPSRGRYISNLLSTTVSACLETDQCAQSSIQSMRCSVKFKELSAERKDLLEELIRDHAGGKG